MERNKWINKNSVLLLFLVFSFSFVKGEENIDISLLYKKWKVEKYITYDGVEMPLDKSEPVYNIEFMVDGTIESYLVNGQQKMTAKWSFSKENDELQFILEETTMTFTVVVLSNDKLVLKGKSENGDGLSTIMIPCNK